MPELAKKVFFLVEALGAIAEEEDRQTFTPSELFKLLSTKEGFEWLRSTKALASLLNPLGLFSIKRRYRGSIVRAYHLVPETIQDLKARYADGAPESAMEGTEK